METSFTIVAHHEAGHALIAYAVGWNVDFIELKLDENLSPYGHTLYDFGNNVENSEMELKLRVWCAIGGPVAQNIFEQNNEMDLNRQEFASDMNIIDSILDQMNEAQRQAIIKDAITNVSFVLRFPEILEARESIVRELLVKNKMSQAEFLVIVQTYETLRNLHSARS